MAELSIDDDDYNEEYNEKYSYTKEEYDLLCKKKHDILLSEYKGDPEVFEKFWNSVDKKWQATIMSQVEIDRIMQEIKDGKVMSSEDFWRHIDEKFGLFDIL